MYRKRLYFFVFLCFTAVSVCFCRLAYMQIVDKEKVREIIRQDRIKNPTQLPTVRGSIYDRCGKVLATDMPRFDVQISYQLTKFRDSNFWRAIIYKNLTEDKSFDDVKAEMHENYKAETDAIDKAIEQCSKLLKIPPEMLLKQIEGINEYIWKLRETVAWRNSFPESELYSEKGIGTPYEEAMEDFEKKLRVKGYTDPTKERYKRALGRDLSEAYHLYTIYEINDREQLLSVQEEFIGMKGLKITPVTERKYPYGATASQLIGWVAPAQRKENELFSKDIYSRYNNNELSGEKGIEKVCEVILRGKRGEVIYDTDEELLSKKPTQFGEDIYLAIDIELQHRIEYYLSDKTIFPDPNAEIGAVVIDVSSGEVLAMVSIPTYDLREIRKFDYYKSVSNSPAEPFINKALYWTYPPGSVIKPFFLVMGLETGTVTPGTVISCDGSKPKSGWPSCMITRWGGAHDWKWTNNGRNAIRGSCNIYFSVLADRMQSSTIQNWLYKFGFGHEILMPAHYPDLLKELEREEGEGANRKLRESCGIIWTGYPKEINSINQLPKLEGYEKRRFGIGQASMRVTVLQVANAMATIARDGIFKYPRLYIGDTENKNYRPESLGISSSTIRTLRDGMKAVVYENGGTANEAYTKFNYDEKFPKRDITVYGKTGSTQKPYNAWFAGFTEDKSGRSLAFAIAVKRGKSGAKDAAPKGMKIIEICNEMGYIGKKPEKVSGP